MSKRKVVVTASLNIVVCKQKEAAGKGMKNVPLTPEKAPKVFVFVFARDHNLKAFDVEQNFYRCVGVCITMGNKVEGKMKYVQRNGSPAGFE